VIELGIELTCFERHLVRPEGLGTSSWAKYRWPSDREPNVRTIAKRVKLRRGKHLLMTAGQDSRSKGKDQYGHDGEPHDCEAASRRAKDDSRGLICVPTWVGSLAVERKLDQ
jgi:hypothetical protein